MLRWPRRRALERWFSLIHQIWDSGTRLSLDRVVNRLLLKDAGVTCAGGTRDEQLVQAISQVLLIGLKKRPMLTRAGQHKRRKLGDEPRGSYKTKALAAEANRAAASSGRDQSMNLVSLAEEFQDSTAHDFQSQRASRKATHRPAKVDDSCFDCQSCSWRVECRRGPTSITFFG